MRIRFQNINSTNPWKHDCPVCFAAPGEQHTLACSNGYRYQEIQKLGGIPYPHDNKLRQLRAELLAKVDAAVRARIKNESPHVCTPEDCPSGIYFVTCIDGDSWWPMSGPYPSHAAALADVETCRRIACDRHAKAWWYRWGTARMPADTKYHSGRLNDAGLVVIGGGQESQPLAF